MPSTKRPLLCLWLRSVNFLCVIQSSKRQKRARAWWLFEHNLVLCFSSESLMGSLGFISETWKADTALPVYTGAQTYSRAVADLSRKEDLFSALSSLPSVSHACINFFVRSLVFLGTLLWIEPSGGSWQHNGERNRDHSWCFHKEVLASSVNMTPTIGGITLPFFFVSHL